MKGMYKESAAPIGIFGSLLAMVLLSVILTVSGTEGDTRIFLGFLFPQLAIAVAVGGVSIVQKVNPLKAFYKKPNVPKIGFAVLTGASIFCVGLLPTILISVGVSSLGINMAVTVPPMNSAANAILGLVILCLLPPFCEEMLFRGVLTDVFASRYGGMKAVLLSGAFFALYHLSLAQTFYQFFLGMLLCYIVLKTGNLLYTVIIHSVNNILVMFLPLAVPQLNTLGVDIASMGILLPMFFIGIPCLVVCLRLLSYGGKPSVALRTGIGAIKDLFKKGGIKEDMTAFSVAFPATEKKLSSIALFTLGAMIAMWILVIIIGMFA